MLEALDVGPVRKIGAALLSETLLKTDGVGAGVGIARGDGAADAWVAAFKGDFADMEADYAAKFGAEELVFPEGRDSVEFQSCAETLTGFSESHAGKPFADGLERGRGDHRWTAGDEVVGDAGRIMANHDGVTQEFAEPFGCGGRVSRKSECRGRDIAAIIWNGEGNGCESGLVRSADQMKCGDAGCVDEAAIQGIDGPGAVELEAAGGAYGGGGDFDGVEGFDGVDLDAGQAGKYWFRFHDIILTERLRRNCELFVCGMRFAVDNFEYNCYFRNICIDNN